MSSVSPLDVVQLGLKVKAPLTKVVVSAVLLLAGYAIVATWFTSPRDAIVAGLTMLVLVVLIIVLTTLTRTGASKAIVQPAIFVAWSLSVTFVFVILATVSSFFFAWPTRFEQLFPGTQASLGTPVQASVPVEQPDVPADQAALTQPDPAVAEPAFEEFQQPVEYQASNGGSCTENNVVRTFQYCATADDSPLQAQILRYEGPREIWGRNGTSSIQINAPRSGCATTTLRYSDFGRGPFGDCKGNGGIRVQYTLYVRRQREAV